MRKVLHLLLLLVVGLVFNSCTKDSDVFIPDPGQITGPDSVWYADINAAMPVGKLQNILRFSSDVDSIDMDNAIHTINFPSGLECTFPANAFVTNNGDPVSGKIAVEAYLLKKKGELIQLSKPTISDKRMLVSGGTIFIRGKKDGADLKLANDKKLNLRFGTTYISSAMKLFNGEDISSLWCNWKQCADTLSNFNKIVTSADGYEFYTDRLNWMNCNYYYAIGVDDSVKISVKLPSTFTNFNTLAYVVFNDFVSVLPISGDAATKKFISTSVPAGKSVTVVTITKEGNFFYLGHNGFVTNKSSSLYQNTNVNPQRVSLNELREYLNNL